MEHLGQSSFLNEEEMKSKQQKANVAAEKVSMYWEENKLSQERGRENKENKENKIMKFQSSKLS